MEECQMVFAELKAYLAQAPILFKPVVGGTLYMYLEVTDHVVQSVHQGGLKDTKINLLCKQDLARSRGLLSPFGKGSFRSHPRHKETATLVSSPNHGSTDKTSSSGLIKSSRFLGEDR